MLNLSVIKVVVLYGDELLAEGLRSTVRQAGLEVVESSERHDVVITDFDTALDLLALRAKRPAIDQHPAPQIIILSPRGSCVEIRHAVAYGALGYLTADCTRHESVAAIRSVHRGQRYLGSVAATKLAESINCEALTTRELDVLRLVAEGHANKEIARDLDIAVGTVKSHVKAILQKLDSTTRTGAAAVADRRGLLSSHKREMPRTSIPQHRSHYSIGERSEFAY